MTLLGWIIVIVVSIAAAIVAQLLLKATLPYRWVISAIGAFLGAAVSSELLLPNATPQFEGIALLPAIVGGLVIGAVVDLVAVWYSHDRLSGQGHGAQPVH